MLNHTQIDRELRSSRSDLDARRWAFDVEQYAHYTELLARCTDAEARKSLERTLESLRARWPGKTLG